MNRSEQINELAAALAAAQAQIRGAEIDGSAKIKTKSGGEYGYTYTSLAAVWAAIREPLTANGLSILQFPSYDIPNEWVIVETLVLHTSGQWVSNVLTLPVGGDITPQTIGSAITYNRRYSLTAMLGIVSDDDDDGEAASRKPAKSQPRQAPPPPRQAAPEPPASDREFESIPRAVDERAAKANGEDKPKPYNMDWVGFQIRNAFEQWAADFARDYPRYQDKAGRANMPHIRRSLKLEGIEYVNPQNIEDAKERMVQRAMGSEQDTAEEGTP